ncbi:MAG: hypothetical protein ABW134_11800 [Candidatus Thiodiazotropha endolucinida]
MESQKTAFDHDDDYETIEERWNGNVTKQMGNIASSINDAEIREAFVQKYKPRVEAQRQFIRDLAWSKERDQDRADVLERAQGIQDAFATSGDAEMIFSGKGLFDNSKGFSQEEITKHKHAFGVGAVKARLNTIATDNPQKAIDLLNSDMARDNLPEGDRAKLIADYQAKSVDYQAMGVVDNYMARDLSLSAGMDEAQKISDPRLRKAVEERFTYDKRMEKAAEVESQAAIHEDWHVRLGPKGDGSTIDDIPQEQWEILTPSQRQNLHDLQFKEPVVRSDPDVLIQLSGLALAAQQSKDWAAYNQFISENSSKLSNRDRVEYSVLSLENQAENAFPKEIKSDLTDVQKVAAALGEDYDKKQASVILGKLGDWKLQQRENDHEPTDKETIEAIDRFLLEYDERSFWGSNTPYYKLTEEDVQENLIEMRDDNPERYQFILEQFAARREKPTNDQILMLMRDDMTDADVERWFND